MCPEHTALDTAYAEVSKSDIISALSHSLSEKIDREQEQDREQAVALTYIFKYIIFHEIPVLF